MNVLPVMVTPDYVAIEKRYHIELACWHRPYLRQYDSTIVRQYGSTTVRQYDSATVR